MKRKTENIIVVASALAIAAALLYMDNLMGVPDPFEVDRANYCSMVALNKSDPELGWPDYNNSYDKECK